MITISPAHLKPETYQALLEDELDDVVSYKKTASWGIVYGLFVYICRNNDDICLPEDLMACRELAKKNDCDWIMFDCDAIPLKELPIYEEEKEN